MGTKCLVRVYSESDIWIMNAIFLTLIDWCGIPCSIYDVPTALITWGRYCADLFAPPSMGTIYIFSYIAFQRFTKLKLNTIYFPLYHESIFAVHVLLYVEIVHIVNFSLLFHKYTFIPTLDFLTTCFFRSIPVVQPVYLSVCLPVSIILSVRFCLWIYL